MRSVRSRGGRERVGNGRWFAFANLEDKTRMVLAQALDVRHQVCGMLQAFSKRPVVVFGV